jgi:hypothetical protein
MLSEPTLASLATKRDAELEWLLCLAAAHQVFRLQQEKFADEDHRYFQSAFLRGLQALFKGLRRTEWKRAI